MDSRLARYQEMHELAAHMVRAAHADDWERLAELETRIAALRDSLAADSPTASTAPDDLAQQARLIQEILAAHEEVARRTQPALDEMRRLLGDATSRRRLDQAYGFEET